MNAAMHPTASPTLTLGPGSSNGQNKSGNHPPQEAVWQTTSPGTFLLGSKSQKEDKQQMELSQKKLLKTYSKYSYQSRENDRSQQNRQFKVLSLPPTHQPFHRQLFRSKKEDTRVEVDRNIITLPHEWAETSISPIVVGEDSSGDKNAEE